MTKAELIDAVSAGTQQSKKTVADILAHIIVGIQASDKVTMVGFGTFEHKTRAAKTCRNPQTGVTMAVPAKTVLTFKPAKVKDDSLAAAKAK
jgi:nucleoid DNA-binding protein